MTTATSIAASHAQFGGVMAISLVIQGATIFTVIFFLTNCVLKERMKPKTPAFAAQYKCRGGVSIKLAAEPVITIWQRVSGHLEK